MGFPGIDAAANFSKTTSHTNNGAEVTGGIQFNHTESAGVSDVPVSPDYFKYATLGLLAAVVIILIFRK
jgi:hypothetical protein